ncbi:unnamed protein product [Ectocarpus sp. 6 AP-2014]
MQKNEIRGEDRAANEVRLKLEAMPSAGSPQTRKRGRNCVPKFVVALLAPADLSVAFRGASTNKQDGSGVAGAGAVRCRVAVCLSGAVRSFVHPAVHRSIKSNLIESIEADGCAVDVFAYATREDTVPRHKQRENSDFTPNSSDIETAMAILAPARLVWHQEQAGIIPSCRAQATSSAESGGDEAWYTTEAVSGEDASGLGNGVWRPPPWQVYRADASRNLYWQLYKSLAAYRMALREEKRKGNGFSYDWIIRSRFDVAWIRPLPALRSFSPEAVWLGRHYWPISDHFALVPRAFSDRFFTAVKTFYTCDGQSWPPTVSWWQPECSGGFDESVLFRHLHTSNIPFRYYFNFEYIITRGELGGKCHLGETLHSESCSILKLWNAFQSSYDREDCIEALAEWANLRCRALLPAEGMSNPRRTQAVLDPHPRAWQALIASQPLEPTLLAKSSATTAAEAAATESARPTLEEASFAGGSVRPTSVPQVGEVNRARLKLVALKDALVMPPRSHLPEDDVERNPSGGSMAWDGRNSLPLWSIYSHNQCPLTEKHKGLVPHVVLYYTMGASLVRELAQAIRCFVHHEIETTSENIPMADFHGKSCEGTRALELVMIDVSLHIEELGICTADGSLGLSAYENVERFFREPATHCMQHGRLGVE